LTICPVDLILSGRWPHRYGGPSSPRWSEIGGHGIDNSTVVRRRGPPRGAEARTLDVVEELLRGGASFTELSVERIASEAGLSRSTFYLYFRDKTHLILRLASSLKAETFETGEDWDPHGRVDGLDWLARAYLHIIRKYRGRSATLAAVLEVAGYDRAVREELEANQRRFIDRIAERLTEEQRAGRTANDVVAATAHGSWSGARSRSSRTR